MSMAFLYLIRRKEVVGLKIEIEATNVVVFSQVTQMSRSRNFCHNTFYLKNCLLGFRRMTKEWNVRDVEEKES